MIFPAPFSIVFVWFLHCLITCVKISTIKKRTVNQRTTPYLFTATATKKTTTATRTAATATTMNNLENTISEVLNQNLKKCILSSPRKKSQDIKKTVVRPVIIKGGLFFQFEYHQVNKVIHENCIPFDAEERIRELIDTSFKQVDIFMPDQEIHILAAKPEKPRIKRKNPDQQSSGLADFAGSSQLNKKASDNLLSHDRSKNYIIKEGTPCDFLIRLGVMDSEGNVHKRHYAKFRQINRFLEIVDDIAGEKVSKDFKIIDFGCGKAYLTFALYYYFKNLKGIEPEIIGLDLKEDVIFFCNKVAEDLGYTSLHFLHGDIADYEDDRCDMVVTLHACDTATDYALINAVRWSAPMILSVPCCQHELFKQIKNEDMAPFLKHGLLKDRFTELLTDSLRGLALEAMGYDVSMMEFTTLDHTMKNIMIRATKKRDRNDSKSKRALDDYRALRDLYNVSPAIDDLFGNS